MKREEDEEGRISSYLTVGMIRKVSALLESIDDEFLMQVVEDPLRRGVLLTLMNALLKM